ncbi:3-[(3aS,4S,7aS)-7a-methyl-1,5-dioxo-octahydro-1H-inden-4-yl]propanoyl:CoA ligase-like [Pecten maximus]|uniref:3-[(3aS,4S,7aS)-7a-methyl-1, 5-dioxo-octahydro-1H-inden-4-yl]propanoyl:CoA ligase-like n=1 Tax=Pecten maximus TaxID=6579 RepID=UPI001457E61A|nr:3-[(3aS,4S,7aS)-7a-methyl-1,5-dioxo-octahydro-1H-inden-4-yl]propanoyl:CoA ligase-like [Pecten maximus]
MTHLSIANASYIAFLGAAGDRPQGPCYNDRPFSWVQGYKLYAISTGGQLIDRHLTEVCGQCTDKLFVCYGTTEVGGVCFTELTPEIEDGNIGSLFPGYEVKIIGDRSETLDLGHVGEILVRSSSILKSYRDAPGLNEASFVDGGWFRTGDIGLITNECKSMFKGKANDVIKRGGLKVFPSVVEAAISKLSDVREIVVISVPDSRLFEEVCACYILKDGVDTTEP